MGLSDMPGWSREGGAQDPASSPLRALVAGFPGAAAHISGDQIWLNAHAEAIVGYSADELTTLDAWGDAIYRDNEPEAREIYLAARAAGFPQPEVLTVIRKDGTPRLLEFSAYSGMDQEVWVLRDITDTRRAEQELRDREQRLQVAVATAGLGTWEWDVDAGKFTGDATTRRMFGVGSGSAAFADYTACVLADDRARFVEAITAAIDRRSAFDVELRVRADHGRNRWLRMHGKVVDDSTTGRIRLIGAVHDIDSYKRLDERLVHAARMESLGQLAGGVAHDFNNLLAVIGGQVEFVGKEPGLSEKATARIESIERAVGKGADMVARLMELGRSTGGKAAVINLNEVVESTAGSLEQVVGEDITIELRLDAEIPYVKFDEARLSAVILNLATNARDAMPVGGLLLITTANTQPTADEPMHDDRPWVQLTVEDTGIGMDRDTRLRIFEPFFTTKAPGVGTGLGLASVYDAVMDAGGAIDVGSTRGAGTTFSIALPCTQPITGPPDGGHGATRAVSQGQTIMVVEDDAAILEIAADILRDAGYRVVAALGPHEALSYAEAGERPDLLLTDVVMPDLSGPSLAARLSEVIPGLPVLYMSGYTSVGRGEAPMDDAELIRKPFSHSQLLDRVAQLLPKR